MMTIQTAAEILRHTVVEVRVDDDDGHTEYTWSDGSIAVARGYFSRTEKQSIIVILDDRLAVKNQFLGEDAYALLNQLQPLSSLAAPRRPA